MLESVVEDELVDVLVADVVDDGVVDVLVAEVVDDGVVDVLAAEVVNTGVVDVAALVAAGVVVVDWETEAVLEGFDAGETVVVEVVVVVVVERFLFLFLFLRRGGGRGRFIFISPLSFDDCPFCRFPGPFRSIARSRLFDCSISPDSSDDLLAGCFPRAGTPSTEDMYPSTQTHKNDTKMTRFMVMLLLSRRTHMHGLTSGSDGRVGLYIRSVKKRHCLLIRGSR